MAKRSDEGEGTQPLAQVELDVRGTILDIDARLVRELGHSRGQLVGKSVVDLIDPRDRDDVLSLLERIVGDERPGQALFRIVRPRGDVRWVEASARPHRTEEGELRLAVMGRDVTERVSMQQALQEQVEAERRIASLSRSFLGLGVDEIEEGIESALATAGALVGGDRCSLVELPRGARIEWFKHFTWQVEGVSAREKGSDEVRWRRGDYAWMGERLSSGEVVHIPAVSEIEDDRIGLREGLAAHDIRSYLGIPIFSAGEMVAVFDVDRVFDERGWSELEIERLSLIGEILASMLRRLRVEQVGRENDLRLRTMTEYVRDVICESDSTGHINYCSTGLVQLLGLEPAALPSIDIIELLHPEDVRKLRRNHRYLFSGDGESVVTFRARHLLGHWVWLEFKGRSFLNGVAERVVVSVVRDVTEREQERELLQQKVALESLLSNLSREILALGVDEIDEAIDRTLASVGLAARADRCLFVGMKPDSSVGPGIYEWTDGSVPAYAGQLGREQIEAFAWCMRQLREGDVVQVTRSEDLPPEAEPERRAFDALGLRSLLSIPARSGGELVGVLTLHTEREEVQWTEHELKFLRIVSELITGVLRRKRNELALRDSEERYRSLAENARDCIYEMDDQGRYLYVSPSLARLLGRERESLEGQEAIESVHPADRDDIRRAFGRVMGGAAIDSLVFRGAPSSGGPLHFETSGQAFRSEAGDLRVVAMIRDVTERELSKERLSRQLELEGRVAEFSRYFLDLETDQIEESLRARLADLAELAGAEHALLYSFSEEGSSGIEAFEWWDASVESRATFDTDFDRRAYPWTLELFKRRQPILIPRVDSLPPEAEPERRDLRERGVLSMLGIPVVSAGHSVGFLGFETLSHERDWSEEVITLLRLAGEIFVSALRRRRAELQLRESQQNLLQSQKMEAVGRLAGGIAHDFNNHLAVMLGNAHFMRDELARDASWAEGSDLADSLMDLERSAEHCSQLTRSLLAFSRRTPAEVRPQEVHSLVEHVTELVGPLIPASIAFEVKTDDDVENIEADETQLKQVLVNLVVNARDAMPQGGRIDLTASMRSVDEAEAVRLSLERPGDYVELGVKDCGVGMSEEVQEHIFEPFYTTKDLGKGTGLGLAMAYGIVEQSKGVIDVESEVGVGTHFRVLLPASVDLVEPSAPLERERGEAKAETVLVAEDEASVRRLLVRMLSGAGYQVLESSCGAEALDLADGHPARIDLLVSDLFMPGVGGVELAEHLLASRPDVRVLLLSGDCVGLQEEIRERVPGAECMQKPFSKDALLHALRALLDNGES